MTLLLGDLIAGAYSAFDPACTKLHFAQSDGTEDPLDVLRAGDFAVWQQNQTKRNFSRRYLATLVQTPAIHRWLFAGLWRIEGDPVHGPETYSALLGRSAPPCYVYPMEFVTALDDLALCVTVAFAKPFRTTYPNWETCAADLAVASISELRADTPAFPGFRNVRLPMRLLLRLIAEATADWRAPLSSVGGVYLIADGEGRQYVGSATGAGGLWQRWSDYAATGHGGNVGLRSLDASAFTLSILETADTRTEPAELLRRETHWKLVLGSRVGGLNQN